jgi:hypothetical protein
VLVNSKPPTETDEVEVVARALLKHNSPNLSELAHENSWPAYIPDALAALAALAPLRQAERERVWREACEAMREVCKRGVLGGSFLHDEAPSGPSRTD